MLIELNQFQSYYEINEHRGAIVDFLFGTITHIYQAQDTLRFNNTFVEDLKPLSQKLSDCLLNTRNKDFVNIVLIPSYECNMKCVYCYEGSTTSSKTHIEDINIDRLLDCVEDIVDHENVDRVHFHLLGGEPITKRNMQFFTNFFSRFKHYNYVISCISNGLEITANIDTILKNQFKRFQITLDGDEIVHNNRRLPKKKNISGFEMICKGVDLLLDHGLSVELRVNIDEGNIHSIPSLNEFIMNKNWMRNKLFQAYIYPISENGNDKNLCYLPEKDMLSKAIKEINKITKYKFHFTLGFHGFSFIDSLLLDTIPSPHFTFCSANTNQYVFDPSGKIYGCWRGFSNNQFDIGTVNNDNYHLDNDAVIKLRDRNVSSIADCKYCKFRFICGGGCTYKAMRKAKNLLSPHCAEFDELFKIYLRYRLN